MSIRIGRFFRPRLVEHFPGGYRGYRNFLGYKKEISYCFTSAEGKNRVISSNNIFVRISSPIVTTLNICKSFLGIPIVSIKKTVISDGSNVVGQRAKGYFKSVADRNIAYAYTKNLINKR